MESTSTLNIQILVIAALTAVIVVAGVVATLSNILTAGGPKERRFLLRVSFGFWSSLALLLSLMWYLPNPWRFLVLLPYFIIMPIGIYEASIKGQLIREIDENDRERAEEP